MKTIAVMQPYFFPYIGYWQLIQSVDRFIIYDDVNYIKGGWINRNRLMINGNPTYITALLQQASSYKRICDIDVQPTLVWRDKLVRMVEMTYKKSTYFAEVFPLVEKLIRYDAENLADYLAYQLQALARFMGINTEFIISSRCYENEYLSGQARILNICEREAANTYINPQGGQTLYDAEIFRNTGVELYFTVMRPLLYKQKSKEFVPYLSIIDVLMENSLVDMQRHLNSYELLTTDHISNNMQPKVTCRVTL